MTPTELLQVFLLRKNDKSTKRMKLFYDYSRKNLMSVIVCDSLSLDSLIKGSTYRLIGFVIQLCKV